MWKSFAFEPHGEWSEFADECIDLMATVETLDIKMAIHSYAFRGEAAATGPGHVFDSVKAASSARTPHL
jgi:hypothetical protein